MYDDGIKIDCLHLYLQMLLVKIGGITKVCFVIRAELGIIGEHNENRSIKLNQLLIKHALCYMQICDKHVCHITTPS